VNLNSYFTDFLKKIVKTYNTQKAFKAQLLLFEILVYRGYLKK